MLQYPLRMKLSASSLINRRQERTEEIVTVNIQTLMDLGWSDFYAQQIASDEADQIVPMRISTVHRVNMNALAEDGAHTLLPQVHQSTGDFAVGDWVLADPKTGQVLRTLERKSVLKRYASGSDSRSQLIAANIDTLFIVTSCNDDFKVEWIDLFLALAHDAEVYPVVVLTKTDTVHNPNDWISRAKALSPSLEVIGLDTADALQLTRLEEWCQSGKTVAMVGSSGVGKSTLLNELSGLSQATGELSSKVVQGRHTTTTRSLHRVKAGGWIIDTPGIRGLRLYDGARGIDSLFNDVADLANQCHFRDCSHENDPGCAIQAAISNGTIDIERFNRWQKLHQNGLQLQKRSHEATPSLRDQKRKKKPTQKKRR